MTTITAEPGDVLAVRSTGWAGRLIRLGAALRDQPNLNNHIAVVHHTDAKGTTWVYEGRPGGVGQEDARPYLTSQWTISNAAQPRSAEQRAAITTQMDVLFGTAYDWDAIVADAAHDLGWQMPGWDPTWHGTVPGHVVCSSAAAYAYAKAGVPHPAGDRGCQPADWDTWILTQAWK